MKPPSKLPTRARRTCTSTLFLATLPAPRIGHAAPADQSADHAWQQLRTFGRKATKAAPGPRASLALAFILIVGGISIPLAAQTPSSNRPTVEEIASHRATMDRAVVQAKANDVAATAAELAGLNRNKPNTAGWQTETAQRLLQVAERLARSGQRDKAVRLAQAALECLGLAERLTAEPRARASAKMLMGFVQERYLGDHAAALANYQAAAALSPTNARAKEAATRLESTVNKLKG